MSPSTEPVVNFDSLEQEVFLNLWRTYDRLRILEDALFAEFELTAQQYNVLRLLRAERPQSLQTLNLAQRLISRAPDITRMLDHLEKHDLIERQRLPENRRVVLVSITADGLLLLDRINEPLRSCHLRQLGHLSEAQQVEFVRLLKQARSPHEPEGSSWY